MSAHGFERLVNCFLRISAPQADRSHKSNTGSNNNQSCLINWSFGF